jgi:hypothetical protein
MQGSTANPLILALLLIARCLIPVGILLGLSYLVRRLGLVEGPPPPASEAGKPETPNEGLMHGRP